MLSNQRISRVAALALSGLLAVSSVALAKPPSAEDQLNFGVKMAKRGLWSEALFRFQAAGQQAPGDPRILNNLAVAYEAVGRFDDAQDTYRKAIQAAPGNRDLKRNYSQFLEFYQGYSARADEAAAAAEESSQPPAEPEDDGGQGR